MPEEKQQALENIPKLEEKAFPRNRRST